MKLTNKLIATFIVSIRHHQTMSVLSLLPTFVTKVSTDLDLGAITHNDYEALVKHLLASGETSANEGIRVCSREALLIAVSVMHLAYSLETGQDLAYILDVVSELGISAPKRKEVKEIFYRLCRGLKLNEIHRHTLLDSFEKNRALQLDDLLLSTLSPKVPLFYAYA